MNFRQISTALISGLLLAFLYYWLVVEFVGYSAAMAAPKWVLSIGHRTPTLLTWTEALNTAAMAAAALLSALAARLVFGSRALMVAGSGAVAAAIYGLMSGLRAVDWSHMHVSFTVWFVADYVKMAVLPVLLVLALRGWPSNTRWSEPRHE